MKMNRLPMAWLCGCVVVVVLAAMAPATVAQEPRVVVYSSAGAEIGEELAAAFMKRNPGIKVESIYAGTGVVWTRVRAEAARPQGDVCMCGGSENFDINYEFLETYRSNQDADIPAEYKDPRGPRYYGMSLPIQVIIINSKLVPRKDYPRGWRDLADPKWKGKIIWANPRISASAYAQLFQLIKIGGWDLVKAVLANAVITPSSGLAYQGVADGEFLIGMTGEGNVYDLKKKGYPVDGVYPVEGTGLRFDATGLIKGCPNPGSARLFYDFANSRDAHLIYTRVGSRRSVRPDVPTPQGMPPTSRINLVPYDAVKAGKDRGINLIIFDEMMAKR
ncbi:MAG: extracellular solute-binding protein [bacterium]|nr:extracellular solute-binding protein [bacterium]